MSPPGTARSDLIAHADCHCRRSGAIALIDEKAGRAATTNQSGIGGAGSGFFCGAAGAAAGGAAAGVEAAAGATSGFAAGVSAGFSAGWVWREASPAGRGRGNGGDSGASECAPE